MPRSNSAILITDTNAHTGSFFGIQSTNDGATFDEVKFVGKATSGANFALTTGSLYEAQFTQFKLLSGEAIVYVQSTD